MFEKSAKNYEAFLIFIFFFWGGEFGLQFPLAGNYFKSAGSRRFADFHRRSRS